MSATTRSCTAREFVVEDDSLELCSRGLAGVAVPDTAADVIDPTIAIDVEAVAADVGRMVLAEHVPHPLVRAPVLEPVDVLLSSFPPVMKSRSPSLSTSTSDVWPYSPGRSSMKWCLNLNSPRAGAASVQAERRGKYDKSVQWGPRRRGGTDYCTSLARVANPFTSEGPAVTRVATRADGSQAGCFTIGDNFCRQTTGGMPVLRGRNWSTNCTTIGLATRRTASSRPWTG